MSSTSPPPALPRELDPTVVSPGLVGLFFFVALFVAVFFLMRSMVKQLRRIDIPGPAQEDEADTTDTTDTTGTTDSSNA